MKNVKEYRNISRIIYRAMIILLTMFIILPTYSYAANEAIVKYGNKEFTIGNDKYKGTAEKPIELSLKYDKITFVFDDKFIFPFIYEFTDTDDNGNYIGKYIVKVDSENKKVIFTKIAATNAPENFSVTPARKSQGKSYYQAGAIYNNMFYEMGFSYPTYKIEAYEVMNAGEAYVNKQELGNSTLDSGVSMAANLATYPSCYVFCSTKGKNGAIKEGEAYFFEDSQFNAEVSTYKGSYNGTTWKSNGKITKYKVETNKKAGNLNFGDKKMNKIQYVFYGSSSELLDEEEAGSIEKLISNIGISIGDMFLKVLYAVCGKDLQIDNIVFNHYNPTILDYFGNSGLYLSVIKRVVNGWFSAFRYFAIVVLVVILVAIGVKSILYAGTSKQNKIGIMISGWIIAVALMFFGPYLMKYAIELNDAIVRLIAKQSEYSLVSVYNMDLTPDQEKRFQEGENSKTTILEILNEQAAELQVNIEDVKQRIAELNANMASSNNTFLGNATKFAEDSGIVLKVVIALPDGTAREYSYKSYPTLLRFNLRTSGTSGAIYKAIKDPTNILVTKSSDSISGNGNWFQQIIDSIMNSMNNAIFDLLLYNKVVDDAKAIAQANAELIELEEKLAEVNKNINIAVKNIDLIGTMRNRAGQTYRFVYVLIWFLLIFQLVALLVLYYKRLLTVAVLIIIYPLVIMFYAIEKLMCIEKPKAFSTWIKEYLVNIFVQSVHALVYVMLVESGLKLYESNSDNWILFVMAVLAMFPAESIIKNIIGMKAKTVSGFTTASKAIGTAALAGSTAKSLAGARGSYKKSR